MCKENIIKKNVVIFVCGILIVLFLDILFVRYHLVVSHNILFNCDSEESYYFKLGTAYCREICIFLHNNYVK